MYKMSRNHFYIFLRITSSYFKILRELCEQNLEHKKTCSKSVKQRQDNIHLNVVLTFFADFEQVLAN